jgi:hypothetical protein
MLLAAVTRQQGPETYTALLPQLMASAAEGPMQVCAAAWVCVCVCVGGWGGVCVDSAAACLAMWRCRTDDYSTHLTDDH